MCPRETDPARLSLVRSGLGFFSQGQNHRGRAPCGRFGVFVLGFSSHLRIHSFFSRPHNAHCVTRGHSSLHFKTGWRYEIF